MSEKFRWGSSDEESGAESSWSGPISLNSFLEKNHNFNNVMETIRTALTRMMLAELKELKALLESGTVVVNNKDQRNQVNEELKELILKRKSAIIENEKEDLERKHQLIPARRRRNTRGDFRQVSSEDDVGTGPNWNWSKTGPNWNWFKTGPNWSKNGI